MQSEIMAHIEISLLDAIELSTMTPLLVVFPDCCVYYSIEYSDLLFMPEQTMHNCNTTSPFKVAEKNAIQDRIYVQKKQKYCCN